MWRTGLLGAALVLAGCAGPGAPEVTVSLYQTRSDTPLDRIEIQVTNIGDDPVTVGRAELISPRLAGPAAWDEPVEIPPGMAVDLKVQLPEAVCPGAGGHEVRLTVAGETTTMAADDTLGQLQKYLDGRCFEQAVEQTTVLDVEAVTGTGLRVRVEPGAATVGALRTTILFAPVDSRALAAAASSPASTREVALRPNRCDAHALAEDKQGTYFPVEVTLADGRTGDYTMGVDQQQRGQLYRLYARRCGLS